MRVDKTDRSSQVETLTPEFPIKVIIFTILLIISGIISLKILKYFLIIKEF